MAETFLIDWETKHRWAMEHGGTAVGGIDLVVTPRIGIGEIHYSIAPRRWNQGLMTEGCKAVVEWGFRERGLVRIWTMVDVDNVASARVLQKLGMRQEGVLRKSFLRGGELRDMAVYGLLREEWLKPGG